MASLFHAQDGLYFEALDGGDLRIIKTRDGSPTLGENVTFETTIRRSQIASIMAFSCARGYCQDTFYGAYEFLQCPKDKVLR